MWFKLAFGVAFVAAAAIATRAARAATQRHGGALNQLAREVPALVAIRAALGLVFYASLGAWLIWPRALPWMYLPIPIGIRWAAVIAFVPVLAFFAWSFRSIGTNYRGGVGLYDEHELVTTGAYRRIRHPIYAGFIAIMVLVLLLSANWVLGLSGLLLVATIAIVRIPIEERELGERFGALWMSYRTHTGWLLPRIRVAKR
jgi:protein-S-isoprenylcysteine O-methyltransferase Ste14